MQFAHALSAVSIQFIEPVDVIVKSSEIVFADVWVVAVEIVSAFKFAELRRICANASFWL